jgi:hypothetical protein
MGSVDGRSTGAARSALARHGSRTKSPVQTRSQERPDAATADCAEQRKLRRNADRHAGRAAGIGPTEWSEKLASRRSGGRNCSDSLSDTPTSALPRS